MRIVLGLFRLTLMVFLVSCTSTPPANLSSSPRGSKEVTQLQTSRAQIRSRLDRREFLEALRLMQHDVNSGVSEGSLAEEYALALRGGMINSDELSAQGGYSDCGLYLRQLLNLYPHKLPVNSGFSVGQIHQRIDFCSDQLMVQGLAAYRSGEMAQAINLWTKLLLFDPKRSEAQKAIDTCSVQLRNLKSKF